MVFLHKSKPQTYSAGLTAGMALPRIAFRLLIMVLFIDRVPSDAVHGLLTPLLIKYLLRVIRRQVVGARARIDPVDRIEDHLFDLAPAPLVRRHLETADMRIDVRPVIACDGGIIGKTDNDWMGLAEHGGEREFEQGGNGQAG